MPSKPRAEYDIHARDASAAGWRSALSTADRNAKKLKSTLGSAFAGVISVQLFTSQISKAIEFGDEIGKLKVKLGATAGVTQELVAVARQFDVEINSLATSFKKMQIGISQAATGNKELLTTFAALGLNVEELRRLKPDEQFEVIGDAISRLREEEDRARAETVIFGRSGSELRPMFENGAAGIRKARMEVREFGQVLSDLEIKKLQEADDAIKTISATWDSFWRKVAVGTVSYGKMIAGAARELGEFATQQGRVASAARLSLSNVPFVGPLFTAAELQAQAEASRRRTRGPTGAERGRGRTASTPPGFGAAVTEDLAPTGKELRTLMGDIRRDLENDPFDRDQMALGESLRAVEGFVQSGIAEGIIETNEAIGESFEDLQEPILQTTDAMTVFGEEAARNMQDHFAEFLFDPFEDGLKGMLKGFIDVIRRMVAEAASAKLFDSLGGISGVGNFLGSLFGVGASKPGLGAFLDVFSVPKYAAGTNFVPHDQLAYVHQGEQIVPAKYNNGSRGGTFAPVYNIDARGATVELISRLPAVLKANNEQLEAQIVQRMRRGYYGGGRT